MTLQECFTHWPCVEAGLHVLAAKPVVKKLHEHLKLTEAAKKHGVLCVVGPGKNHSTATSSNLV